MQTHRSFKSIALMSVMIIAAVVVSSCTGLPPVTSGTPAPGAAGQTGAAPSPLPTQLPPTEQPPQQAEAAREALARELGIAPDEIQVISVSPMDWPDGCLGIQQPGRMCTMAIVAGYQIILEANGRQYEYRTDLTGSQVALAPDVTGETAEPEAALRARAAAAAELGLEAGLVRILSVEEVEWPDPCLGVPDPLELCAQVVTPGYRVVLEGNGQQLVYHTDATGQNVRRERQPQGSDEQPEAALRAREMLAEELGVDAGSINFQRADPMDWPDACLMVPDPAELCAQVITPGYKVFLELNGEQYIYHTDETGANVRRERQPDMATPSPESSEQVGVDEAIIGLRNDIGGCTDVRVALSGVSSAACGGAMAANSFLTDAHRLEQLTDMQKIFSSFGVSTPAGRITFLGKGPIEAAPIEQRMIAEWANLVAQEVKTGPGGAQYGFEWRREGGIAGFCDDVAVDAGGHATWSSCNGDATPAGTWRRLTHDELTQFYAWLDEYGPLDVQQQDPATADAMTVTVTFAGRGTAEATDADKANMLQFGNQLLQQWADPTPIRYITTQADVSIHEGPGEEFDTVLEIAAGQQALVTGVNRSSTWWRVVCPDDTVGPCWVSGDPTLTQPVAPAGSTGEAPIDETGILAAVIRQVFTVDSTFGEMPDFPIVYLLAVDDTERGAVPDSSIARSLAAPVQQGITAALADLPTQFKWAARADEVPRDENNSVAGNGAIITVGNIQPQPDGKVHVAASIYVGMLAAGGQTYVLERQDSVWKITGTVGPVWIS